MVTGAGNYWDAAHQNSKFKRERAQMVQQIIRAKAVLQENGQLKAALQLRERSRDAVATGRIVGSSFNSPRRFAILSAGSSDGVRIGMPVRSPDGLVGRVVDSGMLASRILLVSDRASIVPARLLRNGIPVIAQGRGDGTVDVRPLEVGRNPFRRGDIIVTSGTGGLYPPLVPIARVVKLDDDGAIGMPLADPATISFAIVEPPFEPAATADAPAEPDDALMVRAALGSKRKIGQGPVRFATAVPAASVVCRDLAVRTADHFAIPAGIRTSDSSP